MTSSPSQDGATSSGEALFNARIKAIFEDVLAANAPALVEAAARKALDFSRAEIEQRVKDAKAEVDAYRKTPESQPPPPADTPQSIAKTIHAIIDSLPDLLSRGLDDYDKLVNIRLKQQSPLASFEALHKANPTMAAYVAQLYAPDPLQTVMPQLLAKNSLDTANAVVRTLMRQGVVPRGGRLAIDPFGEDSETLEELGDNYESPTPEPRPQSVEMHRRARGAKPKPTTLREALA